MNRSILSLFILLLAASLLVSAQQKVPITLQRAEGRNEIAVFIDGKHFTSFLYPDTLEKPILFPIYAPDGRIITRGFPLAPRPGESTDHPHHAGLWFNYENVNGLDFWNNSFAIPQDKKKDYGWIRTDSVTQIVQGKKGRLVYEAGWRDQSGKLLLRETTEFVFSVSGGLWLIDRISRLEAAQDVSFEDAKDGCLGLRVARELELPSAQAAEYTDQRGNKTSVAGNAQSATGNYLTSTGRQGDSAWGTRASWCMLYGKMAGDTVSITIIDHPANPGYPTYWHARGYGLFAANPLGQKIFSQGKEALHFRLAKGTSVRFRYRIAIGSGMHRPDNTQISRLASEFAVLYR